LEILVEAASTTTVSTLTQGRKLYS
jgi:hypothetical protein